MTPFSGRFSSRFALLPWSRLLVVLTFPVVVWFVRSVGSVITVLLVSAVCYALMIGTIATGHSLI